MTVIDIVTLVEVGLSIISKAYEALKRGDKTVSLAEIQAEIKRISDQNAIDDAAEWAVVRSGKKPQ